MGTDARHFTIDEFGELSFVETPDYDRETNGNHGETYDVILRAGDGRNTARFPVTVTLTDVDEGPLIEGKAMVTVNEVIAPRPNQVVRVGAYTKRDPERSATNWGPAGSSMVLSGADSAAFAFDQQTGRLTFASPPDYENGRPVPGHPDRQRWGGGGNPRCDGHRRQRGGDGHAHLRRGGNPGRQRRAATGDADGSGRRRHRDVGVAAQDGQVGPLDGHREHQRQLYAERRRRRPVPARERHVHGRGRYERDHLDQGHRSPDGERRLGEPAPDAARPASPGRRYPGERQHRTECRASGVHRPGGRAADLLARGLG